MSPVCLYRTRFLTELLLVVFPERRYQLCRWQSIVPFVARCIKITFFRKTTSLASKLFFHRRQAVSPRLHHNGGARHVSKTLGRLPNVVIFRRAPYEAFWNGRWNYVKLAAERKTSSERMKRLVANVRIASTSSALAETIKSPGISMAFILSG